MEEFCLGIFANSDKADRESPTQPPDVSLAGRFYISSLFFDVLTQFHPGNILPPDLEEKRKYAKYRTIQIRNRKPIDPQPDNGQPQVSVGAQKVVPSSSSQPKSTGGFHYNDTDSDESPRPPAPSKQVTRTVLPVQAPVVASVSDSESAPSSPTAAVSRADALNAKKKLQMAISAIDFADYNSARSLCDEVLRLLNPK